jgi:hypothetical protein
MATSKLHRDVVLEHNAQPAPPELDGESETGAFWVAEGAESGAPTRPFFTDSDGESYPLGNVLGPAASVDETLARFDEITGKTIQGGTNAPSYDDSGNLSVNAGMALRLWNPAGTFYVGLKAPAVAASYTLTMPTSLPGGTRLLQCDSVGNLSWTSTELLSQHHDLSGLGDDDHTQYLLANGTRTAAYIKFGTYPASQGYVRLPFGGAVYSRNYDNNGDLALLSTTGAGNFATVGSSGIVTIGLVSSTSTRLSTSSAAVALTNTALTLDIDAAVTSLASNGTNALFYYHDTMCAVTAKGRCTVAPLDLS